MNRHEELRASIFMMICCVLGLFLKRVISPVTNIVTDFIRMPGGGVAGGVTMSLLVLGASLSKRRWAGTFMGLLQGLLALALGMGGYQGPFAVITFTVPGIAIDAARYFMRGEPEKTGLFYVAGSAAAGVSAIASNLLVFRFKGLTFLLWVTLAMCAGLLGGLISGLLYKRIKPMIIKGEKSL